MRGYYSDLLQNLNREHLLAMGSQRGDLYFCVRSIPLLDKDDDDCDDDDGIKYQL